jgi:hypothetical protein
MTSKSKSIRLFLMWTALLTNSCVLIWAQDGGADRQTAPTIRELTSGIAANPRQPPISKKRTLPIKRSPSKSEKDHPSRQDTLDYAHNVKIVTRDGNVILKGPLRSIGEKRIVETKAIAIAGEDRSAASYRSRPNRARVAGWKSL